MMYVWIISELDTLWHQNSNPTAHLSKEKAMDYVKHSTRMFKTELVVLSESEYEVLLKQRADPSIGADEEIYRITRAFVE